MKNDSYNNIYHTIIESSYQSKYFMLSYYILTKTYVLFNIYHIALIAKHLIVVYVHTILNQFL